MDPTAGQRWRKHPPEGHSASTSLTRGLVLYAIARHREIGIELEHIRPLAEAEQIAARFFSARENAVFRALHPSQRAEAFFNCWPHKGTYIKAIGDGLARPLEQLAVILRTLMA
jgi:4'-phosphopantetheinyl transferase